MILCKYKDIFGEPNTGLHKYRIKDIAIVDILALLISSYIISYKYNICIIKTIIILFLLGIILHRIFCVRTTIDKIIFANKYCIYCV